MKTRCVPKIYLAVFLLLFTAFTFAQPGDNPNNLRAKIFELSVKTIPSKSYKLPFQAIKIIDSRPDTSKLGFRISYRFMASTNSFEKIMIMPGIEKGIENFYNEYYKYNFTPNGKVLLIILKKLWINSMPDRQAKYQRKNTDRLSRQDIYAKFEYYLGSLNAYVPLKRVDTIFQLTPDTKVEDYDAKDENKLPFFCFALEKMIENINYEIYVKDLDQKKKMSVEDIEKYNAETRNIPILNEAIKKGIFITFNEFKNNQPSVISFSKRKIPKRKIYEITDEKGNVIRHYFAYYDGEKLAIVKRLSDLVARNISQDNYGIYKVGDSFQFFENYPQSTSGSTSVNVDNNNIPVYIPGREIIIKVPRQIDLETGEVY